MKCRACKGNILQKSGGKTRLRIQGPIVFEDGVCKSKCFWCKSDIEIPLEICEGTPIPQETFILKPRRRRIKQ